MEIQLVKTFSFESAHSHAVHGHAGKPVHGHSFRADAIVTGPVDRTTGWVTDFAHVKEAIQPVIAALDHRYLNEMDGMEDPTAAGIARWIEDRVQEKLLPFRTRVRVRCREETRPVIEALNPDPGLMLPERVVLRFEAAHCLLKTPEGHKCRRLHGHSYRLEVGGVSPEVARPALERIFSRVDHSYLNDIEELENPTAEEMCGVFWEWLRRDSVQPECLALAETCESGCIYFGDRSL